MSQQWETTTTTSSSMEILFLVQWVSPNKGSSFFIHWVPFHGSRRDLPVETEVSSWQWADGASPALLFRSSLGPAPLAGQTLGQKCPGLGLGAVCEGQKAPLCSFLSHCATESCLVNMVKGKPTGARKASILHNSIPTHCLPHPLPPAKLIINGN